VKKKFAAAIDDNIVSLTFYLLMKMRRVRNSVWAEQVLSGCTQTDTHTHARRGIERHRQTDA